MGKTRDLFKKSRDSKGTFHAKMGSIKDRNGMYLTEAEDIKKRWQEYTELYKKDLHNPDNHDGVITYTHLEPNILECEVKWASGSITMNKAKGSDGIPVELFQILKDDAVKVNVFVAHSCLTLCDPMDCSSPGSSVHGVLLARLLEWVAISFSRGTSQPRDWTQVCCTTGRFFTIWATRKAQELLSMAEE